MEGRRCHLHLHRVRHGRDDPHVPRSRVVSQEMSSWSGRGCSCGGRDELLVREGDPSAWNAGQLTTFVATPPKELNSRGWQRREWRGTRAKRRGGGRNVAPPGQPPKVQMWPDHWHMVSGGITDGEESRLGLREESRSKDRWGRMEGARTLVR